MNSSKLRAHGASAKRVSNLALPVANEAELTKKEKRLITGTREIPFTDFKNQKTVIAYATLRKRNEISAEAEKAGLTVAAIKEPHFYLSPEKLEERLAQPKISAEETPFLLKIILWHAETLTGDREEISLEREEFGLFDLIADIEGTGKFWKKAVEKAAHADLVLIHHYAFAHGNIPSLLASARPGLIIEEASRLEDSFTLAFRQKFTESRLRPFFGEKAAILFGLIGIFYERYVPQDFGGFRGNTVLNDSLRASIEWRRAEDAAKNLPEHPKKTELLTALSPHENSIQWIDTYGGEVAFHSAPLHIADFFRKATAPFQKVTLHDETATGPDAFRLIRELFELDSDWREEIFPAKPSGLKIIFPEDLPEPNSSGYFKKCAQLFQKLTEEHRGKCLFLMSSKKAVDTMYGTLLPTVRETKLLALGPSGGKGKIVALFLENPETSVLLATNQILPNLPEIEKYIEVIVFQKIPFDSPGDPIYAARSKQFKNGFAEYALPRAVSRFRDLLAELDQGPGQKICYLLDSRLLRRDYGKNFL